VDYGSGPYDVIIPAGDTSFTFDVTIIDDDILENDEDFNLTIVPGTLPNGVTSGDPGRSTVTIINDDGKSLQMTHSLSD